MYNSDLYDSDEFDLEELAFFKDDASDFEEVKVSQIPSVLPWQIFRPGQPPRPNMPAPPPTPPFQPNPPSNSQQPRTPPPSNAPQLPRGMVLPPQGSQEYNVQFDRFNKSNQRDRQFKSCLNRFTFVWLWSGRSFWFYPVNTRRWSVDGFIWYGNRWIFNSLNYNSIFFYRCF